MLNNTLQSMVIHVDILNMNVVMCFLTHNPRNYMINRQFTLIEAARTGDLKTVQQLLAMKETNINAQDSNGTTALITAANNNHENIVNVLLLCGADINMVDARGMSALMVASEKGYSLLVNQLLVMKANFNQENFKFKKDSTLGLAIKNGHVDV